MRIVAAVLLVMLVAAAACVAYGLRLCVSEQRKLELAVEKLRDEAADLERSFTEVRKELVRTQAVRSVPVLVPVPAMTSGSRELQPEVDRVRLEASAAEAISRLETSRIDVVATPVRLFVPVFAGREPYGDDPTSDVVAENGEVWRGAAPTVAPADDDEPTKTKARTSVKKKTARRRRR